MDAIPSGGTALEVGSGPGWDADFVESQGIAVRRTDITTAFIELQAERGEHVERLDVTSDELGGPSDAVMALSVLQHVDRAQIPALLRRVAGALQPGGVFLVSILEGVGLGVEWSRRGEDSEESRWLMLLTRKESSGQDADVVRCTGR